MVLGLVGALAAALCYGVASIMQAVAASRTETTAALDPRLLVRLAGQWLYVGGVAIDGLGFLCSLVAFRSLPLFLVESALAASIGVTAALSALVLHVKLARVEVVALVGLTIGLVLLAVSALPGSSTVLSETGQWIILAGLALVLVAAGLVAKLGGRYVGVGLAAVAGLSFSGLGLAARAMVIPDPWWHLVGEPLAWAVAGYGLVGMLLFTSALQRGSVTTVTALTFGIETTVPTLLGLLFLGDKARPGFAVPAALGFVLAVVGSLALARHAEPSVPAAVTTE